MDNQDVDVEVSAMVAQRLYHPFDSRAIRRCKFGSPLNVKVGICDLACRGRAKPAIARPAVWRGDASGICYG